VNHPEDSFYLEHKKFIDNIIIPRILMILVVMFYDPSFKSITKKNPDVAVDGGITLSTPELAAV